MTYFDPFWVSVRIYRAVRFMAWDKIFSVPMASAVFRRLGAFPVSLDSPESGAYKTALKILQKGEALMLFPEGGRSPDGNLMPFKNGAARLALKTGAALLPVAISGGTQVWSPQMWAVSPNKSHFRLSGMLPVARPSTTLACCCFLPLQDHRSGRNLSNFLYGACLTLLGHVEEAQRIFACLPPPRPGHVPGRWARTMH